MCTLGSILLGMIHRLPPRQGHPLHLWSKHEYLALNEQTHLLVTAALCLPVGRMPRAQTFSLSQPIIISFVYDYRGCFCGPVTLGRIRAAAHSRCLLAVAPAVWIRAFASWLMRSQVSRVAVLLFIKWDGVRCSSLDHVHIILQILRFFYFQSK